MTVGVYGIFCADTGDCLYVGQSKDAEYRFKKHLYLLRTDKHRRKDFVEWFKGKNEDSLIFTVLEETEDDDLTKNLAEIKWFNKLSPRFFGKQPSVNDKWAQSEETRKKIGEGGKIRHRIRVNKSAEIPIQYEYNCAECKIQFILKRKKTRKTTNTFCSIACSGRFDAKTKDLSAELVTELYHNQKMSLREVAARFNFSHVALTRYMERNGIPKREKNELKPFAKVS